MRVFAALLLALGVFGMADVAFAMIYVPGHIRDGVYIRPHFVSAPKLEYRPLPGDGGVIVPEAKPPAPPAPDLAPGKARGRIGEPS